MYNCNNKHTSQAEKNQNNTNMCSGLFLSFRINLRHVMYDNIKNKHNGIRSRAGSLW